MRSMVVLLLSLTAALPLHAEVTRVSGWLDRIVVTDDGELLGSVEDLAINQSSFAIDYVVVSVGSYLVAENLIAVAPDAFQVSDDNLLMISKQVLADAPRFSDGSWPDEAQVKPLQRMPAAEAKPQAESPRTAEIVSARRKLVLSDDGQTSVVDIPRARRTTAAPAGDIAPKRLQEGIAQEQASATFERFDTNSDGYLSRRELGPHMETGMKFSDFDLDANGGIDSFEFRVLQESR